MENLKIVIGFLVAIIMVWLFLLIISFLVLVTKNIWTAF